MSQQLNTAAILEQIFQTPANEIKTERFSAENQAASCSGSCSTGACRTLV